MRPALKSCLIVLLVALTLLAETCASQADDMKWVSGPSNILTFADHLYETRDYFRGISEYKRFIYLFPNEPRVGRANFRIGLCYQKSGNLENAIHTFREILRRDSSPEAARSVKYEIGKCYFLGRDYQKAGQVLGELNTDRSLVMAGWSMLRGGRYAEASGYFERAQNVRPGGYLSELSSKLSRESLEGEGILKKSPVLAAFLSVPLPGAGRTYCGRLGDGIFSFLLVSASYVAAYHYYDDDQDVAALGFLAAGLFLHTGDIYGAAISARRFNAVSEEDFLKKIENKHNLGSILLD